MSVEEKCPNCNSLGNVLVDYQNGQTVCKECGLVLEENFFVKTVRKEDIYHAAPGHLGTIIDGKNKDIYKQIISPYSISLMRRLRKRQFWSLSFFTVKTMTGRAAVALNSISTPLRLTRETRKKVMWYFKKYEKKGGNMRGRSADDFMAAMLYFVCRKSKDPLTLSEILDKVSILKRNKVVKSYKEILLILKEKVPPPDYSFYFLKLADKLNLSPKTERAGINLLKTIKNYHPNILWGKDPKTIAAAVIYLVCKKYNQKKSQKEISDKAKTTEASLRNRKRQILEFFPNLI